MTYAYHATTVPIPHRPQENEQAYSKSLHYGLHLRSSPYSPSLFWATQETNSHGHSLGIDAAILTRHSGKRESTQKQAKFSRITSCLPFYPILEYLSDSSSKPLPFNLKVTKMH